MKEDNLHITQDDLEIIEKYLAGDMPADARKNFEQTLDDDPLLQQKLQHVKELQTGIQEVILQERLEAFHKNLQYGIPVKSARVISFKRLAVAASVACLVLLAGWLLFLNPNKNEKLFATYYKPDPGLITAMSTSADYIFDKGMVAYKIANYEEAISLWKSVEQEKQSDTVQYFLGSAYMAKKDDDKALTYLNKVAANNQSAFNKDANWFVGLLYLKSGDQTEAKKYIEKSEHRKKQELLNALNNAK